MRVVAITVRYGVEAKTSGCRFLELESDVTNIDGPHWERMRTTVGS